MPKPYLSLRSLSLRRGEHEILQEVNLTVDKGEIVCLFGPSGSGKSSLLRCVNRLNEPSPNTVFLEDSDITTLDVLALRRKIGMVFQTPALFPGTVSDNLRYGPALEGDDLSDQRVSELLKSVDLAKDFSTRGVEKLSGGEAQRVSLARALANQPEILLLDEPTSALDPPSRRHIWETIAKLRREWNMTFLWVTHDLDEVKRSADRGYMLVEGRVVEEGPPSRLFGAEASHAAAFALGEESRL